jgi:hypothetical protein
VYDTSLPRKGDSSVGVAPQYSGTMGNIANYQLFVSAEYVVDEPSSSAPLQGRSSPDAVSDHLFDHLSVGVQGVPEGASELPKSANRLSTGVHGGH